MVKRNPVVGKTYEWLGTKDKILEKMPQLSSAHIDGWEAYWVTDGGWVAAKDTIDSIGRELERLGVKRVFGPWVFLSEGYLTLQLLTRLYLPPPARVPSRSRSFRQTERPVSALKPSTERFTRPTESSSPAVPGRQHSSTYRASASRR